MARIDGTVSFLVFGSDMCAYVASLSIFLHVNFGPEAQARAAKKGDDDDDDDDDDGADDDDEKILREFLRVLWVCASLSLALILAAMVHFRCTFYHGKNRHLYRFRGTLGEDQGELGGGERRGRGGDLEEEEEGTRGGGGGAAYLISPESGSSSSSSRDGLMVLKGDGDFMDGGSRFSPVAVATSSSSSSSSSSSTTTRSSQQQNILHRPLPSDDDGDDDG